MIKNDNGGYKTMKWIDISGKKKVILGILAMSVLLIIFVLLTISVSTTYDTTRTTKNPGPMYTPHTSILTTTSSLGIFYYPWTGGNHGVSPNPSETWLHWKDGGHKPPKTWDSNYLPDLSPIKSFDPNIRLYSAKDTDIINEQLKLMRQAGIGFVISSWWGQNSYEDQTLDIIFNQILSSPGNPYPDVKFCIYYEKEGFADVPKSEIVSDINYIKQKYASSPYYYKINGKPVIFVYNADTGGLADAQKWSDVRNDTGIYTILKVFTGYKDNVNLADSWHQYGPATPGGFEQQDNYSAFITPGFHKWSEQPRLGRENFTRWENDVIKLNDANVQFKLIETWNEWGEGTGIEPAQKINHDDVNGFTPADDSYGTKYIDILSKYFAN